jgi:LysM repeat protein
MVNKTKLGLTGLLLATTLSIFSQNKERKYIEETIYGTEYSDKKIGENTQYALEEQVLFGKIKKDMPIVLGTNPDIDGGELDFYICPVNELSIAYGSNKIRTIPKMYIPTKLIDFSNKKIEKMELTGINTNVNNRLERNSQNSFGYNQTRTDEDIQGILPRIEINGQEYAYWMATKGKYITEDNKEFIAEMIKGKSLDIILFPITEDYEEIINLACGNITIKSPEGIYVPVMEEIQTNKNEKECSCKKTSQTKTPNKNTSKTEKNCTYVVKSGETFWEISSRFYGTGKDAKKLMDLNNYKSEDLKTGAILKVPCEKDF